MANLLNDYLTEGRTKLQKELSIGSIFALPKLEKIVINTGLGEALTNKKVIETVSSELSYITSQKPLVTYAKKDISSFKLRKGEAIGLKVTLRGKRMYDFLEKLVKIVLPRLRDFRGVSEKGFDNSGNFTLGIVEQIVFPEIDYSKIDKIRGLEITFVIKARDKSQAKRFLEALGMPFRKD